MKQLIICLLCPLLFVNPLYAVAAEQNDLTEKADVAFWKKDFVKAETQLLQITAPKTIGQARLLVNLAICDAELDRWEKARKEAIDGIALAAPNSMDQADGLLVLARCLIVAKDMKKAHETYKKALTIALKDLGPWNSGLAVFYEGLAACELYNKNLPEAEALYKKVAQLDYLKYGPDAPYMAWSLLTLSELMERTGREELSELLFRKAIWNFRRQNEERIIAEIKPEESMKEAILQELRQQLYGSKGYEDRHLGMDYIKEDIPPEILAKPLLRKRDITSWFMQRVGREVAPGTAFFDPSRKLKALILTIHGLGLHNGAYEPFARRVHHEGLGIISFDVRGFGSYRNDEVYQEVNFKAIISDFRKLLTMFRRDYPGVPIFVLGESMGGAIALRLAALYPQLVDGVISSVPSGTRFQAKSTAVSVALKYIKNSHKQFDIGERVVGQATNDPSLKIAWEEDPKARMKLSAAELVEFQKFMNDNLKYAERIKQTPVIIFQGFSDQLVKPLGTLALYQAISSRDKDLLFVGHAEHLIFEEGQFDADVVDGLVSWINKHISQKTKAAK